MKKVQKINWARPFLGEEERALLLDAYDSTWISGGAYVERFEREFSDSVEVDHVVTTSNGTTALLLAFLALGIGADDEVIVPGFGFLAAANMAISLGARPVFVDVDERTWCIDPEKVEEAITSKTKAIIAVHTYGNVCDLPALQDLAKNNELFLIEDTAEACFSTYDSQYAGTVGDVGCFSFQATKTLAMGEGGCVTTRDKELSERMRLIRNHGMQGSKRYWHYAVGYNFRLPNLQAAIGCGQLAKEKQICDARRELYARYRQNVAGLKNLMFQEYDASVTPVAWTMALCLREGAVMPERDRVIACMAEAGIETRPGFYAPSSMPIYAASDIAVSEKLAQRIICLPLYVGLSVDEVDYICEVLRTCLN